MLFIVRQTKRFSVLDVVFDDITADSNTCTCFSNKRKENKKKQQAIIYMDIICSYTQEVLKTILGSRPWCKIVSCFDEILSKKPTSNRIRQYQISDFENIDWVPVMSGRHITSSYLIRKGLSRKAQLSLQVKRYISKNPTSILRNAIPYTIIIETWDAFEDVRMNFGGGTFANFNTTQIISTSLRKRLEFCLQEVHELVEERKDWLWILKPSVTNKGMDIAVVRNWEEILDHLEDIPDIREWVLQKYIADPLLVEGWHKFHLRVYVVCVGALNVYVYNDILMLIGAHEYNVSDLDDIYGHLTNTARAVEDIHFDEEKFVQLLDDLPSHLFKNYRDMVRTMKDAQNKVQLIRSQIHEITKHLFACFENEYTIFAPMSNCFEIYGLDFMVDESFQVHLLEVNPGPDFKQTGSRLKQVILKLWDQVCSIIMDKDMSTTEERGGEENTGIRIATEVPPNMTLVYSKEWSVSKHQGGMKMNSS